MLLVFGEGISNAIFPVAILSGAVLSSIFRFLCSRTVKCETPILRSEKNNFTATTEEQGGLGGSLVLKFPEKHIDYLPGELT